MSTHHQQPVSTQPQAPTTSTRPTVHTFSDLLHRPTVLLPTYLLHAYSSPMVLLPYGPTTFYPGPTSLPTSYGDPMAPVQHMVPSPAIALEPKATSTRYHDCPVVPILWLLHYSTSLSTPRRFFQVYGKSMASLRHPTAF